MLLLFNFYPLYMLIKLVIPSLHDGFNASYWHKAPSYERLLRTAAQHPQKSAGGQRFYHPIRAGGAAGGRFAYRQKEKITTDKMRNITGARSGMQFVMGYVVLFKVGQYHRFYDLYGFCFSIRDTSAATFALMRSISSMLIDPWK